MPMRRRAMHSVARLTPYLLEFRLMTLTMTESPVSELFNELLSVADNALRSGMTPDNKGIANPNTIDATAIDVKLR